MLCYIFLAALLVLKICIKILLFYLLNISNFLRKSFNYIIFVAISVSIIYSALVKLIATIYYLLNNYVIGPLFSVKI